MVAPIGFEYPFYIPSTSSAQLSTEEKQYVQELVCIPLDSILTYKKVYCKNLGQKIFDQAKSAHNGDAFKARDAVVRIYNAIYYNCNIGHLRMGCIKDAWNGIGDETWHWMGFKSDSD